MTNGTRMNYCLYYQAYVLPEMCWYVVATLRSHEHLAFDRTLYPDQSIFEFFVAPSFENTFKEIMQYHEKLGYVNHLKVLPNRLLSENI